MTRYLRRSASLGGLLLVGGLALSAGPSGATEVCQTGTTNCHNVKPTAVTRRASRGKGNSATLRGDAGAGVSGGDPTTYYFQYGTSRKYGHRTHSHVLGACPAGISAPSPYCTTPSSAPVSARIARLKACTRYHFRTVATNPDGTSFGADKTFKTGADTPIRRVRTPSHVQGGHIFKVKITLGDPATVTVSLVDNGRVVKTYHEGHHRPGTFAARVRAPTKPGKYTLRVHAKESCGSQTVS